MDEKRNQIEELEQAGIPAVLADFECGCWGKHQPPTATDTEIIIAVGQGYRSNRHLHGQNTYILDVDAENRIGLIEMRKYGDLYGSGLWHYLVGVDGAPFVAQVPSTLDTLAEALNHITPAEVKRALAAGKDVVRQGDWFFIPVDRTPSGEPALNVALDDDHVAAICIRKKSVTYVQGAIQHGHHTAVGLDTWHKAIQNNVIRTGRLARGGGAD